MLPVSSMRRTTLEVAQTARWTERARTPSVEVGKGATKHEWPWLEGVDRERRSVYPESSSAAAEVEVGTETEEETETAEERSQQRRQERHPWYQGTIAAPSSSPPPPLSRCLTLFAPALKEEEEEEVEKRGGKGSTAKTWRRSTR